LDFRPSYGWQLDPFGHSRTFAYLLSELEIEYLFLGRIDMEENDERFKNKEVFFEWVLNEKKSVKVHVFLSKYDAP
jgi:hypothetical protein